MIVDYQCTSYISDTLVGFVKMVIEDKGREVEASLNVFFVVNCKHKLVDYCFTLSSPHYFY